MKVSIGSSYLWKHSARVGIHAFGRYFLSKGYQVEWFTIPFSFLYFLKLTNLKPKWKKLKTWLHPYREIEGEGVLNNWVPFTPVHPVRLPLLGSYVLSRSFLNWSVPSIPKAVARDGISAVDILIFDSGGLNIFYPLQKIARFRIYRLNDLVSEFPGQVKGRIESEREILRKVDVVLAVSESLYAEAIKIRGADKGVYLLPNGVNIHLFQRDYPIPPEYEYIPPPRAIFVGALSSWFSWDILRDIALQRPKVSFVVVGRGEAPYVLPENVYLEGPRPHESIPAYLQHADVGLILFKDMPIIHRIERPLKFYEYLAAGLPVVSVPYGSLRRMAPWALFGDTPEHLARALDEALELSKDAEERARREEEAKQHSWERVFQRYEEILNQEGIDL